MPADLSFDPSDRCPVVRSWMGKPVNCEREKCDCIDWSPLSDLPQKAVPHIGHALK